jgi:hypothetical protein
MFYSMFLDSIREYLLLSNHESAEKSNRQQGKGVYIGVWAKPTPQYILLPFSLLGLFQCIQSLNMYQ